MKQIKPKYIEVLSKYTMPFTYLILSIVGLALCTSCVNDKLPSPAVQAEEVDVDLSVHVGLEATDDPNATPEEKQLVSLRVYAFDSNGIIDNMKVEFAPTGFISDPKMLTMKVEPGKKIFAVIGNEPAELSNELDKIESIFNLRKLIMTMPSSPSFNDIDNTESYGSKLPFATETNYVYVYKPEEIPTSEQSAVNPTHQKIQIGLARSVAKVDFTLIKGEENQSKLIVSEIKFKKAAYESYIIKNQNIGAIQLSQRYEFLITELNGKKILKKSENDELGLKPLRIKPRYLYENYALSDKTKATIIELKCDLEGKTLKFEIPIYHRSKTEKDPEDTSKGKPVYNVNRNTYYSIRATLKNNYIEVDYLIKDWTPFDFDKTAGEDDSGLQFTDWNTEGNSFDVEIGEEPTGIEVVMNIDDSGSTNYYNIQPKDIRGLPKIITDLGKEQNEDLNETPFNLGRVLIFSQDKSKVYNDLIIKSDEVWEIKPDNEAKDLLSFSTLKGGGSAEVHFKTTVKIQAQYDLSEPKYVSFDIKYSDERTLETFYVALDGTYNKQTTGSDKPIFSYVGLP